jgi:hypothetical protein
LGEVVGAGRVTGSEYGTAAFATGLSGVFTSGFTCVHATALAKVNKPSKNPAQYAILIRVGAMKVERLMLLSFSVAALQLLKIRREIGNQLRV